MHERGFVKHENNLLNYNIRKEGRKEVVTAKKYELVTAQIMRRLFTSNYYCEIEMPLLMNITKPTKKSAFLTDISTNQNKDALADLFTEKCESYLVGSRSFSKLDWLSISFSLSNVNLSRTDFVFGKI